MSYWTIEEQLRLLNNQITALRNNSFLKVITSGDGNLSVLELYNRINAIRGGTACNYATYSWNATGELGTVVYLNASGGTPLGSLKFVWSGGTLQTIERN